MSDIKSVFKVTIRLSESGFTEIVNQWDVVKEGVKTYTITYKDKWGETITKHKKKEQIGIVDTSIWSNSITGIAYTAWCFESDIEKFKAECKEKVIRTATNYKASLDKLLTHLL